MSCRTVGRPRHWMQRSVKPRPGSLATRSNSRREKPLCSKVLGGKAESICVARAPWGSKNESSILEFQDVPDVEMKGGDLRACMNEWELTLVGMSKTPQVDVPETIPG